MIKIYLMIAGWTVAHAPRWFLRALCRVLGRLMLWLLPRRRRIVLSNLHHAFPEKSAAWRETVARESSRRLMETALLSLAAPFLSEMAARKIVEGSPALDAVFREHRDQPFPLVIGTLHLAYWETLTWLPLGLSVPMPETGVIFRPLNQSGLDAWVKCTRERFGLKLLSRKTGLQEAFKILRRQGAVALLFDQNAGMQGALTTLLGRVGSTTELLGVLTEKERARVVVIYPRRLGFWRLRFELAEIASDGTPAGVTIALNRWLEEALTSDENLCASWLWSHDRWRNQDIPEKRFRLEAKRNFLEAEKLARGWSTLPKKTRIWIRLPNWLGDVVMALPVLRALRESRPDAELTFFAKPALIPFLERAQLADRLEPLPKRGRGYFRFFWSKRNEFPDTYVLFTHSLRGDLEAWLTRAPQRFGVVHRGQRRPLLTHACAIPTEKRGSQHQLEIWKTFFQHFGLRGDIDRAPLPALVGAELESSDTRHDPDSPRFGFIAGSENTPEKRWPVAHWRTLLIALSAEFPRATFVLFGTAGDRPITLKIAEGVGARAIDLAGKTDLPAFLRELRRCDVIVSNDTGGMHLANAVGKPLVALFGPTNPERTGPVFSSPFEILRAPQNAAGLRPLESLAPETVLTSVRTLWEAAR